MNIKISPPDSIDILLQRAHQIAGKTIGQLVAESKQPVPDNLTQKKGWQGQFIESVLGASAGNLSEPDFPLIGVELKTLPIDFSGKVLESTYVCVVNLNSSQIQNWQQSTAYKKLNHVLWVPIAKKPDDLLIHSTIATPFLWQASQQELCLLQKDWEDAMDLVNLGKFDQLNARAGEILQVRPKAAHSRVTTKVIGKQGEPIETLPRGFYLRSSFTQKLLDRHLKRN